MSTEPTENPKPRKCMADMHADPPRDCDAPYCGCDPAWSVCMSLLEESGWTDGRELRASIAALQQQVAEQAKVIERAAAKLQVVQPNAPDSHERVWARPVAEALSILRGDEP